MTSNLDCVGLGVQNHDELDDLVKKILPVADPIGTAGPTTVTRWQDPSGARLILAVRGDQVLELLPSYGGTPGARLTDVTPLNDDVVAANVVDADGDLATRLACELEQRLLLPYATGPVGGQATVLALGVGVGVHADADAFAASDASLVDDAGDDPGEPPAEFVERGWPWPPRVAAESFIPYGLFGEPDEAQAYARLGGTVLRAQRRTVELTGRSFVVARVRTAGFEVDLCLADADFPELPVAGNVISGTVFLVASLPFEVAGREEATGKRSWLPWRR